MDSFTLTGGGEQVADFSKQMNSAGVFRFGVCGASDAGGELLFSPESRRLGFTPKSIITAVFPYLTHGEGNLCLYARVPDYHEVVGRILKTAVSALQQEYPDNQFAAFADASPVREVAAAAACGLGCVGKNGLLITPNFGSYVFIGCILTDLYTGAASKPATSCLECGECKKHCPGQAISERGFEKKKCLSDITQRKGELTPEERALVKKNGLAWGCDVCQTVCPMNKNAGVTDIPDFLNGIVPNLDEDNANNGEGRAWSWRGTGVLLRNLEILHGL